MTTNIIPRKKIEGPIVLEKITDSEYLIRYPTQGKGRIRGVLVRSDSLYLNILEGQQACGFKSQGYFSMPIEHMPLLIEALQNLWGTYKRRSS